MLFLLLGNMIFREQLQLQACSCQDYSVGLLLDLHEPGRSLWYGPSFALGHLLSLKCVAICGLCMLAPRFTCTLTETATHAWVLTVLRVLPPLQLLSPVSLVSRGPRNCPAMLLHLPVPLAAFACATTGCRGW